MIEIVDDKFFYSCDLIAFPQLKRRKKKQRQIHRKEQKLFVPIRL